MHDSQCRGTEGGGLNAVWHRAARLLVAAIENGAVTRVRRKLMTVIRSHPVRDCGEPHLSGRRGLRTSRTERGVLEIRSCGNS